MEKYKEGKLHSGNKEGPKVKDKKQAVAIMLSEKKKASEGKSEYKSKGKVSTGPSPAFMKKFKLAS